MKGMNITLLDDKSYLLRQDNKGEVLPIETLNMVLNYPNINYIYDKNTIGIAKIKYDLYKINEYGYTDYSRKFLSTEELIPEAINQINEKNSIIEIEKDVFFQKEEKNIPKKRRKLLNLSKK